MPLRISGPDLPPRYKKDTHVLKPPMMVTTGRSSKPRKVGTGDPVFGFLVHAAKAIKDEVVHPGRATRVAKRTGKEMFIQPFTETYDFFKPDIKAGLDYAMSTPEGAGAAALAPVGIKRLLKAGHSAIDTAEPVGKTLERVRHDPKAGVHVVHGPNMGYVGDKGFPDRFPWVTDIKTGHVYVGKIGDSHSDVLARVLNTTDRKVLRHAMEHRFRNGFHATPGNGGFVDLEWGAYARRKPPKNLDPSHRLMEMMFGKSHNSPYELKHFWNPDVREELGGGLTHQTDEGFLEDLMSEFNRKEVTRLKAARMKHGYGRRPR